MFFFLSKLSYLFIQPSVWLLALLLARVLAKSPVAKKRWNISIAFVVLVFGNEVLFVTLCNTWQLEPVTVNSLGNYNAGILPGGLTTFDKNSEGFLNGASDRLIETAVLYKAKKINKIIVTGGTIDPQRPREAFFLQKKLVELGIQNQDIIVEPNSRTTYENALFTKTIIDSLHLQPPFVLVTSALHIRRAKKVFEKAGIQVIPFPADYARVKQHFAFYDYFIPSVAIIGDWSQLTKEMVGLLGYSLFNRA